MFQFNANNQKTAIWKFAETNIIAVDKKDV